MNRILVSLAGWLVAVLALSAASYGQPSAEEKKAAWLADQQRKIQLQVEEMTAAYQLDEAMQKSLLAELQGRIAAELGAQQESVKETQDILKKMKSGELKQGSPEARAALSEVRNKVRSRPLDDEVVAAWLESKLPPAVVSEGRQRLKEIWSRREAIANVQYSDSKQRSGASIVAVRQKGQEEAPLSAAGAPMANGPRGADLRESSKESAGVGQTIQPDETGAQASEAPKPPPKIDVARAPAAPPSAKDQPAPTTQPKDQPPAKQPADAGKDKPKAQSATPPAPPAPAPPLSEWDKYVISVAQKYGFTDSQVTKARGILADLRKRAEQYRLTHANDYALAEAMTDPKARGEKLKQLNLALDAMFAELKARLENLPTMEQKQKAEASAPPKKAATAPPPAPKQAPPAPAKGDAPKKGK